MSTWPLFISCSLHSQHLLNCLSVLPFVQLDSIVLDVHGIQNFLSINAVGAVSLGDCENEPSILSHAQGRYIQNVQEWGRERKLHGPDERVK
jgi:hypothetical protein